MARSRSPLFANRRVWLGRLAGLTFALVTAAALGPALSAGCSWDPRRPFERNAPEVEDAIKKIESGQYESAEEVLAKYLGTGICGGDGGIAIPDTVREKPNGGFDLGLVLFHIAEKFGRRFGEEEMGDDAVPGQPGSPGLPGTPADDPQAQRRSQEVDCALLVVKAIANDPKVPIELRARAQYLAGNLEFLRKRYEEAVKEYDLALTLIPGIPDDAGGDGIGRDAAWNRAIALRRILDQKDAGNDADSDAPDDADADAPDSDDADSDAPDGNDGDSGDSGDDGGKGDGGDQDKNADGGGQDGGDAGAADGGNEKDSGSNDQKDEDQPAPQPTTSAQPVSPDSLQDDRILDHLEEAPSYQEEEAKKRAAGRRKLKMEDK
ncbi:MAG: hypothetical protein U0441_27285 [Polyangiaceae bacterium]